MLMRRWGALLAMAAALHLIVGAQTAAGGADRPERAVEGLLGAIASARFDAIDDWVCTGQVDALERRLDLRWVFEDAPPAARAALARHLSVMVVEPAMSALEEGPDAALVLLTATIYVTVDESSLEAALQRLRLAPRDALDEPLRRSLLALSIRERRERLPRVVMLDTELDLIREGGRWVVCGDLGWGIEAVDADELCSLITPAELRLLAPIEFAASEPIPDGCAFSPAPDAGDPSSVAIWINPGDLAMVQSTYPDGRSMTIGGLPAYVTGSDIRVDLGGSVLVVAPTLIGQHDGVVAADLAIAAASVIVPRLLE